MIWLFGLNQALFQLESKGDKYLLFINRNFWRQIKCDASAKVNAYRKKKFLHSECIRLKSIVQ